MSSTTVDATRIMRARLAIRSGSDGRGVLRLAAAAGGQDAMHIDGVGFTADRAELTFEGTGARMRSMPKSPATVALGNSDVLLSRSNGKTMRAVHKGTTDKVAKIETRAGVLNIKPESPRASTRGITGEAGVRGLVKMEILGERGGIENGRELLRSKGQ